MIHALANIALDVRIASGIGVVHWETAEMVQQVIYNVDDERVR